MPLGGPGTAVAGGSGWLEGIMGCFKPVWAIMGKNKPTDAERGEDTVLTIASNEGPHESS